MKYVSRLSEQILKFVLILLFPPGIWIYRQYILSEINS